MRISRATKKSPIGHTRNARTRGKAREHEQNGRHCRGCEHERDHNGSHNGSYKDEEHEQDAQGSTRRSSPKKPNPAIIIVSSHANAQDECKGVTRRMEGANGMQTAEMRAGDRPEDA